MKYKIEGDVMQALTVELNDGEEVYAESGAMAWMTENMDMQSHMKGGVGAGLGRMFTGESLFTVHFKPVGGKGVVTFAPSFPGKILPIEFEPGVELICQKDSFLVAESGVELKTVFTKRLGAGLFGGEGFILQKLSGNGTAFVEIDGEVFDMTLKAGETIKVDTGCVAMFESSVQYDIQMLKGVKNMFFGGEGLFLAVLKGPGRVWLQSMPASNLALKIAPFLPAKG